MSEKRSNKKAARRRMGTRIVALLVIAAMALGGLVSMIAAIIANG